MSGCRTARALQLDALARFTDLAVRGAVPSMAVRGRRDERRWLPGPLCGYTSGSSNMNRRQGQRVVACVVPDQGA